MGWMQYVGIGNSTTYRAGRLIVDAFTRPRRRTLLPFCLPKLPLARAIVPKRS